MEEQELMRMISITDISQYFLPVFAPIALASETDQSPQGEKAQSFKRGSTGVKSPDTTMVCARWETAIQEAVREVEAPQ